MALNDAMVFLSGLIIFVIAIVGSLALGENVEITVDIEATGVDWSRFDRIIANSDPVNDLALEWEEQTHFIPITESNVQHVNFTLTWTDEPDADLRHTNEPDSFWILVTCPDGWTPEHGSSSNGEIRLSFILFEEGDPLVRFPFEAGTGEWEVTIGVEPGDQEPIIHDPISLRTYQDPGNDFTLEIEYVYFSDSSGSED